MAETSVAQTNMTQTTLAECVEAAIKHLEDTQPMRARRLRRRLQKPVIRAEFYEELAAELEPQQVRFGMPAAALIDVDKKFSINVDNLRALLDLIIEKAPAILEIVLTILKMF